MKQFPNEPDAKHRQELIRYVYSEEVYSLSESELSDLLKESIRHYPYGVSDTHPEVRHWRSAHSHLETILTRVSTNKTSKTGNFIQKLIFIVLVLTLGTTVYFQVFESDAYEKQVSTSQEYKMKEQTKAEVLDDQTENHAQDI